MCRPTAASSGFSGGRFLERNGLVVLAAVEDDLRGDAVEVHVAKPGMHIVVAFGATIPRAADELACPVVLVHLRIEPPLRLAVGLELADVVIEVRPRSEEHTSELQSQS